MLFGKGKRLVLGQRVMIADGSPKAIGSAKRRKPLGKLEWDAPLRSATIIIGKNKGKRPYNRAGRCRTIPSKINTDKIDQWFSTIRGSQVGTENVAATRQQARGWYKGDPEASLTYQVIHDPSVPGEETIGAFSKRMQTLAEDLAEHFCQDEVLVVMDTERGKHTYSYAYDDADADEAPPKRRKKR